MQWLTRYVDRLNRDLRDAHNNLLEPTPKGTSLNEEVQDDHTPLEESAAASRVNSMLNDYRGPEISIFSSGGLGKHFSLETSVGQIASPTGRAATHRSNARFADTGKHEEALLNGQTISESNSSSGPNQTTSLSRDTADSAAADELGSDDPAIGLPKDQYQPRPSRSRGNHKENDLLIPESFSKRPEALVKEKRKAKNRRKTTALERPTPKIEVEDEDEEEVKLPLVAIPKLPPRARCQSPYNGETGCEKKSLDEGFGQATAVDQYSEDIDDESLAKQEAKERKELAPASPSPKKRGRGRPKKQSIQPADDVQDLESGDEAGGELDEGSTKPQDARKGDKKRKSTIDYASSQDEHDEGSADEQEAQQDNSNGNDDPTSTLSHNQPDTDPISATKSRGHKKRKIHDEDELAATASDHDDTATDLPQSTKAQPKKRGRKRKTDQPAASAPIIPTDQEETVSEHLDNEPEHNTHKALSRTEGNNAGQGPPISPKKIATPPATPPRVAKPVHSPITGSTVKFRVGLSKRARIAPLLKIVRK